MLEQCLRSEGISSSLWKRLGLPDETAPNVDCKPYKEMELLDLFAAIADRAKASLSFRHSNLGVATPVDYEDDHTADLDAFSAFNSRVSPLSIHARSRGRHASRDRPGVVISASSSPVSIFSSRRSSQGRLATPLASRQVSSQRLGMDRQPSPDVTPPSRLESAILEAVRGSDSPHRSTSDVRSYTGNHSNSSQSESVLAQARSAETESRTTGEPSLVIRPRQESSDGSQETKRTVASSASSSPSIKQADSADTESDADNKRQHPPAA